MARSGVDSDNTFEDFFVRLHEAHDVSVYEGIERLVQAAEEVGYDAKDLLRKLDQGMSFEELLELIEAKMESLRAA